jgi:hypothetical protein
MTASHLPHMVECASGCGLLVPLDGPSICGLCEVASRAKGEQDQRERERLGKLVRTERAASGYKVRTRGYAVVVARWDEDPVDDHTSSLMFSNEARVLAKLIIEAADFVDGLASPNVEGSKTR